MIESRRNRILLSFALVYLVFAGLLVFLLFFNVGLEFETIREGNLKTTALANNSVHIIDNITVGYLDGAGNFVELERVKSLAPGETIPLDFNKESVVNGAITFRAMAPRHQTAEKKVYDIVKVDYQLTVPSKAFENAGFFVELLLCNTGAADVKNIGLDTTVNAEFLDSPNEIESFDLAVGECKLVSLNFKAKKSGTTAIVFNLESDSFNESIRRDIDISP